MVLAVGSYARWNTDRPPPGVDVNQNSAMLVTAIQTGDARGTLVTVSRQGRTVGTFPWSSMLEVRAPT